MPEEDDGPPIVVMVWLALVGTAKLLCGHAPQPEQLHAVGTVAAWRSCVIVLIWPWMVVVRLVDDWLHLIMYVH